MTPSEKATELVDYFMPIVKDLEAAKKCAVKVCEEVIDSEPTEPSNTTWEDSGSDYKFWYMERKEDAEKFWNQVIEQIKAIR